MPLKPGESYYFRPDETHEELKKRCERIIDDKIRTQADLGK